MKELKRTLFRIGFYYLLLAVNTIFSFGFINDHFPFRNLPTIYLLVLSFCLVLYYAHRVPPKGMTSVLMNLIAWSAVLLILFRSIKYSAFSAVDSLARHTWYFYYVPILVMPLCLFFIALLVSRKQGDRFPIVWIRVVILTGLFILLILTNDFHQQVFKFQEGFVDWNDRYEHGWLFYVINIWQFSLYIAAVVILIVKCRVSESRKSAWVILIPAVIGAVLYILLLTGFVPKLFGSTLIEFPEAHIFTIAIVVECCIQLGLVPTNNEYGKIFQNLSISARVTDEKGNPVYLSSSATPLTNEQFALESGSRIEEHTVLYKMKLPGGYGFWQDDMKELDRINEELQEAKEGLEQERELIKLRNELEEQQAKIRQRTILYDKIARATKRQSQTISELAKKAKDSQDINLKDEYRKRIVFLGAYIKRYANLTLLSQENKMIAVGELKLSIAELLHYLNYDGVPGELVGEEEASISSESALALFETLELVIEDNLSSIKGIFIKLFVQESVVLKLIVEEMKHPLSGQRIKELSKIGVNTKVTVEDDITYITLKMKKRDEHDLL